MKTGPYDANVALVAGYPAASGYGFGTQALQISDAVTSGAFGDQTFSPGLANAASETGDKYFEASFSIGTALAAAQPGLHLSVSPDDGQGSRMSYLRFDDNGSAIDVYFDDATDLGPLRTVATFNESKIATFPYRTAHTFKFSIGLVPGPGNENEVFKGVVDNHSGKAVVYRAWSGDPIPAGQTCYSFTTRRTTTDWQDTISAKGNFTLTCHFNG